MLLTLEIAVAADKESTWDNECGFWGECAKVRVGGETPDNTYYESCWIHFVTKGGFRYIGEKNGSLALWI